jgi:integrase
MQNLVEQFLRTYQARLKPSTLRDYRSILTHHISRFEDFEKLNGLLEEYLAGLAITGKRKNNILSACRTFVGWARRREIWEGRFYKIPRFPYRSRKTRPLNPEEARLVMDFSPQPYRDFFRLSILTGLRTGEALALQFQDFDLKARVIRVRRAISGGALDAPKTLAGEREVPILRPVWEIYEQRRKANHRGSPWFFYSPHRGILSLGAIRRAWKDFLEVFDMAPRPLYATRHTFASLAIAAGEDPLWLAQVMGHARPDLLFLKYASYLEGVKRDGEKFLELALGKRSFIRAVT